ncbi:MAG: hydrogenase expression/formation protein HypE [Pyrinomonadaceae bacterium]
MSANAKLFSPSTLFERVERARRRQTQFRDTHITMAHGSGGKAMHDLIEGVFVQILRNPLLEKLEDQAVFSVGHVDDDLTKRDRSTRLAFTTDSFVVDPLFFPGGDIGSLAVNGTVNDLAMSGARPLYLSAGFIIEEGFPTEDLRRIVTSMRAAADAAEVLIVTGDTKVVQRGAADKLFINTAGIGLIEKKCQISVAGARPGDQVILSGSIGDHGTTVIVARGELELESNIDSDSASLSSLVQQILVEAECCGGIEKVHCLRDPTRGGIGTALNEFAQASEVGIKIFEERIPVRDEVHGACEILGLDPLYVANEGKLLAIVAAEAAPGILQRMHEHPLGRDACIIGEVELEPRGIVSMVTGFGGTRIVDMLVGEQLPRIC